MLEKRDCGIKMRLVPYGGAWTDVYLKFGNEEELYFVINEAWGVDFFDALPKALYFLHPYNDDSESSEGFMEQKFGYYNNFDDENIVGIVDAVRDIPPKKPYREIPWKVEFTWNNERFQTKWRIEREPTLSSDFDITISIDKDSEVPKHYEYKVRYKDMCYAVADACTKALKKHGFWGYHRATCYEDMNIRYLLFLKSIALDYDEARELEYFEEKGEGERSDFLKEIELLMFDMS